MKLILANTLSAVALIFSSVSASAEADPVFTARQAAVELKAAGEALSRAEKTKDRVAALGQTVRAYENGLSALRDGVRSAAIRERVLQLDLDNKRDHLSRLLGILQTLERAPTPLLLIHPTGPVGTARSGMMLSEITPSLHHQAEEIRNHLEELSVLRNLQIDAEEDLRFGLAGAQQARVALSKAISERSELPIRFVEDPIRVQILADNSDTLTSFATSLSDIPIEGLPEEQVPFDTAKGTLEPPVPGTLLRGFNEIDAAGLQRPGIVLSARPLSLVTAPWPSTIRYSGPFLDYGNVIILEPDAGYLLVFAGLDQVYGEFGQVLNIGDPVGLLGGKEPAAEEFLMEASEGGGSMAQETLYIELRHAGKSVDPAQWFALSGQ